MHVLESLDNLGHIARSCGLVISALWLATKVIEKFTLMTIFQYQVYSLLISEKTIESENVRVLKVALNFDLPSQLYSCTLFA